MLVVGALAALVGLLLVWGALGPLTEPRDPDGYYMSSPVRVDRQTNAVVSDDMGLLQGAYETVAEETVVLTFADDPQDVRIQGSATGSKALFLGIAPAADVDSYLEGVAHDEITDWDVDRGDVFLNEFTAHEGMAQPAAPEAQTFWAESVSGSGQQTLDWTIDSGEWTVVVMNADASRGVSAELSFGALAPSILEPLSWVGFAVGLPLLIGGGVLVLAGFRRSGERVQVSHPVG